MLISPNRVCLDDTVLNLRCLLLQLPSLSEAFVFYRDVNRLRPLQGSDPVLLCPFLLEAILHALDLKLLTLVLLLFLIFF